MPNCSGTAVVLGGCSRVWYRRGVRGLEKIPPISKKFRKQNNATITYLAMTASIQTPSMENTMNFTYEPMTLDDWKELVHLDPTGMRPAGPPGYWAVDRDNDIQFVGLGGQGSMPAHAELMPNFYVLIWHKQIVKIEARHTSTTEGNGETIYQEVFSIYAPKVLEPEAEAIRAAIPEALLANWSGLTKKYPLKITSVQANMSPINFV